MDSHFLLLEYLTFQFVKKLIDEDMFDHQLAFLRIVVTFF